jgi:hypothetical protein
VANALKPDSFESGFFLRSFAGRHSPAKRFHPRVMFPRGLTRHAARRIIRK